MQVGVDLVEIGRLTRMIEKYPSFLGRVYTDREMDIAREFRGRRRNEFLAGRFAAKEAVAKALRVGIKGGAALKEIEVLRGEGGAPELRLHGLVREVAETQRMDDWDLSISHVEGRAVAFAVFCRSGARQESACKN